MISLNEQLQKIATLLKTDDLNDWEYDFVDNMCELTKNGLYCGELTGKQVHVIERLYNVHFVGNTNEWKR